MNEFDFNPFYILAFVALAGLVFVVMVAGRRKKTGKGSPTPIAPGSPETPVSGVAKDPKKHTK
jgi:hypothetical protein